MKENIADIERNSQWHGVLSELEKSSSRDGGKNSQDWTTVGGVHY